MKPPLLRNKQKASEAMGATLAIRAIPNSRRVRNNHRARAPKARSWVAKDALPHQPPRVLRHSLLPPRVFRRSLL